MGRHCFRRPFAPIGRPLASTESRGVLAEEGNYRTNIERKPASGDVELF